MIHDLDKRGDGPPDRYDVCIVGSGPAGMTVAAELRGQGLTVAVLESGRLRPTRLGDELRKVESDGIVIKDYSRERVLGGASTTWAGLSSPLDAVDMAARPFLPHSGWPLERETLLPYWRAAAARYRFAPLDLYGPAGFSALKSRGDTVLEWTDLEEKIFLAAGEPQDFGREWRSIFEADGIDLFVDATVLRLESSAEDGGGTVSAAEIRTSGGRTVRLEARVFVLATGGIENARLLLQSTDGCPAGLGNERDQVGRYLMNHPKNYFGLIHLHRPVRDLPYHFGCLYQGYAGYAGLRFTDEQLAKRECLNSYIRFEPLFPWSSNQGVEAFVFLIKKCSGFLRRWKQKRRDKIVSLRDYSETGDDTDLQNQRKSGLDWIKLVGLVLVNAIPVARYAWSRLSEGRAPTVKTVRLRNFMEMEPDPDNRVVLGDAVDVYGQRRPVVRHQTTARDRRSLVELHRVLAVELERNGFGRLESDLSDADPWPIDMDASHHMGTTRMGTDPATSVVDVEGRVHTVSNLYLAGTSVFPTSGCANPTLTLVALSIRLAEHLRRSVFGVTDEPRTASGGSTATLGEPGSRRTVLVIGAGGRIQTDVLPVLAALGDRYAIAGIFARRARELTAAGRTWTVRGLDALTAEDLQGIDLIYMAVGKPAVPSVLKRLVEHDVSGIDLMVDTPPLLLKHLGHARLFDAFAAVWVAEDCSTLPWMDLVRAIIGTPSDVHFDRSAYRYHGLAMIKTLMGGSDIRSARRRRQEDGGHVVEVRLANGSSASMIEPRDYARGSFTVIGGGGRVTDDPARAGGKGLLEAIVEDGRCRGFRVGDQDCALTDVESGLVGAVAVGDSVTARIEAFKRVGLYRMLGGLLDGGRGYPLVEALDDMVVDTLLEKTGRYRATPLTSVKARLGRTLLGTIMGIASRG